MTKTIDTVLLTALPASGKSEVRKYLDSLSAAECASQFKIGHTVQLDDYPYVHLMRRIDDERVVLGLPRVFFLSAAEGFQNPLDWGTLIEILNDDYDDVLDGRTIAVECAVDWLLGRYDEARKRVGAPPITADLTPALKAKLTAALKADAEKLLADKNAGIPDSLEGKTVVIEFARGGRQGAPLPLGEGYGYQYSLGRLSDAILAHAAILYIWVSPEESRRKNEARTDPNDPGSILNHGVPIAVMLNEYGQDDMEYLITQSDRPDTVRIERGARVFYLPVGRFDNRVDKTSFIRDKVWPEDKIAALREGLNQAFSALLGQYSRLHGE